MGRLTSSINYIGFTVDGFTLGEPSTDSDGLYVWDDSALPDGTIDEFGVVVTPPEVDNSSVDGFSGTRDVSTPDESVAPELVAEYVVEVPAGPFDDASTVVSATELQPLEEPK